MTPGSNAPSPLVSVFIVLGLAALVYQIHPLLFWGLLALAGAALFLSVAKKGSNLRNSGCSGPK